MVKTSVNYKFQKNRNKTAGGVAHTRYILLQGDGRTDIWTDCRKLCPSAFLRKGGGQKQALLHYENLPMQYTENILVVKNENFHWKNFDIFLIFAQNIDCGYSLEPPRRGGSNVYPQSMF